MRAGVGADDQKSHAPDVSICVAGQRRIRLSSGAGEDAAAVLMIFSQQF
jgi:hypothetical protein